MKYTSAWREGAQGTARYRAARAEAQYPHRECGEKDEMNEERCHAAMNYGVCRLPKDHVGRHSQCKKKHTVRKVKHADTGEVIRLYVRAPTGNLLPCPGSAHENPFIDHCGTCMPRWGRIDELFPIDLDIAARECLAVNVGELHGKDGCPKGWKLVPVVERKSHWFNVYLPPKGRV